MKIRMAAALAFFGAFCLTTALVSHNPWWLTGAGAAFTTTAALLLWGTAGVPRN